MKVITVLSTAILFLLPAAIVPAFAQEHEQEKQPEQKQQQAKPAQHQQPAKPAKQAPQAQHQQPAKQKQQPQHAASQQPATPKQQPQHAARQQQAEPARQQQRTQGQPGKDQQASRGGQATGNHGSIPEAKFRSNFGSGHRFHVNHSEFANGSGRFQYGGYWFSAGAPWPVGWLYTDEVYVDYLNGGYFLCDPVHPGVYISLNIG